MRRQFFDLAFTPSVRAAQERYGSREMYARNAERTEPGPGLGPDEAAFLAEQDGFYLATVSETGWPYVQFRGGPAGFLRPLGPTTLGWADFRGNRQYVSVGNAAADDRAALIVLDYARQARIKVYGRLAIREAADAPELVERLAVPGYKATIERAVTLEVEAFDWNCPQHITPRYTSAQIATAVQPLRDRIAELEAEVAALRG